MIHTFLVKNREELLARSRRTIARQLVRMATPEQLEAGMPLFLEQLRLNLEGEETGRHEIDGWRLSDASGSDFPVFDARPGHSSFGRMLLSLGFTVHQVVHDYGDLCQAITDLAVEHLVSFAIDDFRTLNRCLDNAIADAITALSAEHDAAVEAERAAEVNQRLGFLMHEVRNALGAATMAVAALEASNLPVSSATGAVLKRSLAALNALTNRTLDEVKRVGAADPVREVISVATLFHQARDDAQFETAANGCKFEVADVDPAWHVRANGQLLLSALSNLVQNAFKFTLPHTTVTLRGYLQGDRVRMEVEDRCGGLPAGTKEKLFTPFFSQRGQGNAGLGLGLSIALETVVQEGGTLTVKDMPGKGCVFTIELPCVRA